MASKDKRRCSKSAEGQRVSEVNNKEGKEKSQLSLEVFFQKYVAKWFQQRKVDSALYYACCNEIKIFKEGKESKNQNLEKINRDSLDDYTKQKTDPVKHLQEGAIKGLTGKLPPASSLQEQYTMLHQKYQNSLDRIRVLEEGMNKRAYENDSLSRTVESLQRDLKRSYAQTNDIQYRYSKLVSEKLKNNNPNIADLSDPNRPSEITKHLSNVYDNEWSDAYEIMTNTLMYSEEESLQILFHTVTSAFEFMQEQREQQVELFRKVLLFPVFFAQTEEAREMKEDFDKLIAKDNMEIQTKEIRKTYSQTTSKILAKFFRDVELVKHLAPYDKITNPLPEALKKYAFQCAQLSWHMVVTDPPIYMEKSVVGKPFDLNAYRPYTKSVRSQEKVVVNADVWPALYLYFGGPLLSKGVAQPGHALQK